MACIFLVIYHFCRRDHIDLFLKSLAFSNLNSSLVTSRMSSVCLRISAESRLQSLRAEVTRRNKKPIQICNNIVAANNCKSLQTEIIQQKSIGIRSRRQRVVASRLYSRLLFLIQSYCQAHSTDRMDERALACCIVLHNAAVHG